MYNNNNKKKKKKKKKKKNNLTIEIQRMWNVKTRVILVIIGAMEPFPSHSENT
jgi:hypothetical protein